MTVRLPRRLRLVAVGVAAVVGLGGVVAVIRLSGRGKDAVEVRASGEAEPRTIDDPGPPPDPSSSSSSSSTTAARPVTTTTRAPKPTTTTTTTTPACAPAAPVYVFGLARRPDGSGWAAGGNPALQHSTDAGLTWAAACLPADIGPGPGALHAVVFDAGGRHGWAVGNSGGHPVVFRSTDGGDHWTGGQVPGVSAGDLMDVEFPDAEHGWAVGLLPGDGPANASGAVVLATSDGGATWVAQPVPAEVGRLTHASFVDAAHGWAVGVATSGQPVLITTADGGATWSSQPLPAGIRELRDVAFLDRQRGWAVGALPIPLPVEPGNDDPGVVLTTSDGGTTWTQQATTVGSLWSVQAIDPDTLFAGGGYGLFSTHDGGATWAKQPFALPALDAISFTDANHGWVTHSQFSTICRTDDGGRTWAPAAIRSGATPRACTPA